jgi:hypothetical protein
MASGHGVNKPRNEGHPNRQVARGRFQASQSNSGYVRDERSGRKQTSVIRSTPDDSDDWTEADTYRARHGHEAHEWWER